MTSNDNLTISTERQRRLLADFARLVAERQTREAELTQRESTALASLVDERRHALRDAQARYQERSDQLRREYASAREANYRSYESSGFIILLEEEQFEQDSARQLAEHLETAKTEVQEKTKEIQSSFDEMKQLPRIELARVKAHCEARLAELQSLVTEAQRIVRRRCEWPEENQPALPPNDAPLKEQFERFSAAYARAAELVRALQNAPAAKFVEAGWPVLIFIFGVLGGAYPLFVLLWPIHWVLAAVGMVLIPALVAIVVWRATLPFARRQTLALVPAFQQAIALARGHMSDAQEAAEREAIYQHRRLVDSSEQDLAAAKAEYKQSRRAYRSDHQDNVAEHARKNDARRRQVEESHEKKFQQLEERYPPELQRLEQQHAENLNHLSETYRQREAAARDDFLRLWSELSRDWSQGMSRFQSELNAMNSACDAITPPWEAVDASRLKANAKGGAGEIPAIRFGRYEFRSAQLPGGIPKTERFERPPERMEIPAVLSYPEQPSLLLESEGAGRDAAARLMQNLLLRLLTTFPPGKVRLTIIDPVGLGQNFSAFMHLADFDERLVANRIWTETAHINQRLADLTEHMEKVIQKYLRNEFTSIQEYNAHAGEVAEPFQILAIANFPANFSDEAARRLVSIAKSGAQCGVYTLISTDGKLKLPRDFDLADLEAHAETLEWNPERQLFQSRAPELKNLPLVLESPPGDEHFTAAVRTVGQLAKEAARVEVPFESVLPPPDSWWTADSRSEIVAPLGQAGAKKQQQMRLGRGTSQHVLIAGKTGSGKSTLLNALITTLAAHYSPNELHFYLIDFKKGVEFKAYAAHALPHARVIAIESEREFGLSVLQRLDQELKRRGDLFRAQGVQDLAGYRNALAAAVLPRILLVIDEFQEFFTSDDKISHESALLLDRLVRQGRAFGIHLILGSQTLAGAYSLARSTIGQMAVRIALQCSESDAHLILSEDNTAARLLNRPGEAIYNDANGLLEGNHPFQVVWLSDQERERHLKKAASLAQQQALQLSPTTVFEGNVAADAAENPFLSELLDSAPPESVAAPRAWLGAAVAIKDPTHAVFRRQSGANLLVVGQQAELTLGVLSTAVLALAAQTPRGAGAPSFTILDGAAADGPDAGFWRKLADALGPEAQLSPPRDAPKRICELADEVDRRLANPDTPASTRFLIVHNLARFRDLKRSEEYSFSASESDSPQADKRLAFLLREGPAVGVHTLVWCDSFNNVSRWFERGVLRDFDLRVLLQMSPSDSSQLMDGPAASKLGAHMAYFFSEESGQPEKFRPYGLPSGAWLNQVAAQLAARPLANSAARSDGQPPPSSPLGEAYATPFPPFDNPAEPISE